MTRLGALLSAVALAACSAPGDRERAPREDRALGEPISVRMGGREVMVRCALACEPARVELGRIREGCVSDPTSTPHHLGTAPAMIALACCTEAVTAYEQACDDGALRACTSRWIAECESGRIVPR